MSSIDERIVEMKFDNAQFERGVKQTTGSLEALKKGLDLKGAGNGIDGLSAKIKSFSLETLASGVESIAQRFTTMGIIGVTALVNIANQAVNAGAVLLKSLTLDPILQGFGEYETKMGSIQTILANTQRFGTGLDEVTSSLDQLNTYADKTIYSFGDMTRNIGLFTNAGINIQEATSMIKGFSNEAAASGTTSQGAAGAAYQLSQALSAGTIRLMDWRSLTNVGMGNKNMQNSLIEIAEAMGTVASSGTTAADIQSNFNASLEKGWLSSEVMSNYLQIMAGDMDDAAMAALGLSDTQIAAFHQQQTVAEEAATKVRTWTQLIGTLQEAVGSGWAQTFDIVLGNFEEATDVFTGINDVLSGFIGGLSDARNNLLQGWKDLGGRTALIEGLSSAFKFLGDVVKPVIEAFQEIFPPATAQQLMDATTAFRDFANSLKVSDKTAQGIKSTFKGLFAIFDILGMAIGAVVNMFAQLFGAAVGSSTGIFAITGGIGDFIVMVRDAIKQGKVFEHFFNALGAVIAAPLALIRMIGTAIASMFDGVKGFDLSGFETIMDRFRTRFEALGGIGTFLSNVWEGIKGAAIAFYNWAKPGFEAIGQLFSNLGPAIADGLANTDFNTIFAGLNTGLFAGLVLLIRNFFKNGISIDIGDIGFLDQIKGVLSGVTDSLKSMQEQVKAGTLLKIAQAVGILVLSLIALTLVDQTKLTGAIGGLAATISSLLIAMQILGKMDFDRAAIAKITALSIAMSFLGIAVNILVAAVMRMSSLNWDELARGLVGVAVSIGLFIGASKLLEGATGSIIKASIAMAIMGFALGLMADALEKFGSISWDDMGRGLLGMAGALLLISAAFRVMPPGMLATAIAIALAAHAVSDLASAVEGFGGMSWDELGRGLVALGGALAILVISINMMPSAIGGALALAIIAASLMLLVGPLQTFANMEWEAIGKAMVMLAGSLLIIAGAMYLMTGTIVGAIALLVIAAALMVLAIPLEKWGNMDWEAIGKSMVMLAGSLLIIAGAMYLMTGAIGGAAALIIVAAALSILGPVLVMLGNMSWEQIGAGLTMLAASLGIIALAGLLIIPALPGLLGLGAALLLLGGAVLMAGVGLAALAAALAAFAAVGVAGATALTNIVTTFAATIPALFQQIGVGFIAFLGVIASNGEALISAFVTIFSSVLTAIQTLAPQIIDTMVTILLGLISAVDQIIPPLIDAMVHMVEAMVNALVELIPFLVDAGLRLLEGILKGIADNIGGVVEQAINIVTNFINGISNALPGVIEAGFNLVITFVESLANSIRNNTARMQSAGRDLAMAIIDGMTGGLFSGIGNVISAAVDVANSALQAAMGALGIHSPSREFHKLGVFSDQGFAQGLSSYSGVVEDSAANVGNSALDAMRDAISGAGDVLTQEMDVNPTITPVLDLTQFRKDAGTMSLLTDGMTIDPNTAYSTAVAVNNGKLADQGGMENVGQTVNNVSYVQNVTSPKALSETEIYRHTKNQMSTLKGALGL